MKKVTLYSRSVRAVPPDPESPSEPGAPAASISRDDAGSNRTRGAKSGPYRSPTGAEPDRVISTPAERPPRFWSRPAFRLGAAAALVLALAVGTTFELARQHPQRQLTQADIDAAVLHTLNTKQLPSSAARSYAAIQPSVVRVRGIGRDADDRQDVEKSVGSGVVIVDNGMILTNLHVVAGAEKLRLVFFDGTESDATVVSTQPENDLAVIQAKTLPDDLKAATLRSTTDLSPGDEVIAVGFPFGIGPSVSSGVVSGLRREYRSADGSRQLKNLIQFDAAANPGSSGGPLVTTDGSVVGIVTGILNRGDQRVFIGIGFAVPIENAAAGVGLAPF